MALAKHVISSEYTGEDIYGHPTYDTTRSELGELLYYFKYRGKYDNLKEIIDLIIPFLDNWDIIRDVDIILPVPSSEIRNYQPAVEIAYAIADYLNIHFSEDILVKTSNVESKNMMKGDKNLEGTIVATKKAKRGYNILLVDDLYSTGEINEGFYCRT